MWYIIYYIVQQKTLSSTLVSKPATLIYLVTLDTGELHFPRSFLLSNTS
jgi:hypothetical protein